MHKMYAIAAVRRGLVRLDGQTADQARLSFPGKSSVRRKSVI